MSAARQITARLLAPITALSVSGCATGALFVIPETKRNEQGKPPTAASKFAVAMLPFTLAFDAVTLPAQLAFSVAYDAVRKPKPPAKRERTTVMPARR